MKTELLFVVLVVLGLGDVRVTGQEESPVVTLRAGQLRGTTAETFSRKVYAFKGIPYAKPPVGKRRFTDPEYLKHWMGVWNATKSPPNCLQYSRMPTSSVDGNEDCLYLSVFTPSLTPAPGPLPVIFYIHGGGFMYGGSKVLGPTSLLENDVVLVTVNYRLGPLGFLSTGDDAMPGNFGLKDQAMALRWVRDNIAAFGGDPTRVTLAGNSAGGASVHFHYLSPLSQGLFVRGISMSGCTLNPWVLAEKTPQKTTRLAGLLGCPTSNSRDLTTCLRHRPAHAIVELVPLFQVWKELPFAPFGPVVEPPGLHRFLERPPVEAFAYGEVQDLPWMTGFTTHEGLYTANEFIDEPESMKYLHDNWELLGPLLLDLNDTAADPGVVSQKALEQYFADTKIYDSIPKIIELVGDRMFKAGIIEAVKLMTSKNTAKVHLYQYEHRAEKSYSEFYSGDKTDYGVSHADDLLHLLFENYVKSMSEEDKAVSRKLAKIWWKYAADGTADWSPVDAQAGSLSLVRIKQNGEMEETNVKDAGNSEFWKSLPIEENILTNAHIEL